MATSEEYETRIRALDWAGLADFWEAINRRDTPGWEPGRAFEYLIIRAFELDGAEVRWPFDVKLMENVVEQIDGAVHIAGCSAIVESKDLASGNVSIGPIAKLRNQLLRRPAGTAGLIFSRTDFTDAARLLAQFASPQAILLWSGPEIDYALRRRGMGKFLATKYRYCVEYGLPDYDILPREGS